MRNNNLKRGASVGKFYLYTMVIITIVLIFIMSSCSKGTYYKYAYIDCRKQDVVTTHLIPVNHTLSDAEINQRLSVYRAERNSYVLMDTIVLETASTLFMLK
jgi:hypothetical protein